MKYVVSGTLDKHSWKNSVVIKGDVVGQIKKLKEQTGPNLQVYGSSILAQTLLQHDLVDELWLKIFPITLGAGKRLFAEGTIPAAFKLTYNNVTLNGIIIANYERAGEVRTDTI